MRRHLAFRHEVTVTFSVDAATLQDRIDGYPFVQHWLCQEFGRDDAHNVDATPIDSKERRAALAILVRQGIGGNEMNCLDCIGVRITVDGEVVIGATPTRRGKGAA